MTTLNSSVEQLKTAHIHGKRPIAPGADLVGADLVGADLAGANLHGADLAGADLYGADLHGANLYGAGLYRANLRNADLVGANLHGADLYGADLVGAKGGCLQVTGLHPYQALFIPTVRGWWLCIGCWSGTTDELRALIAQDHGWPGATGEEITQRRPLLAVLADMCDAHAAAHQDDIDAVMARWGGKDKEKEA